MAATVLQFPTASAERPRRTTSTPADQQFEERGVWQARTTVGGCTIFYAVTSTGRRLCEIVAEPGERDVAVAALGGLLDALDPVGLRRAH